MAAALASASVAAAISSVYPTRRHHLSSQPSIFSFSFNLSPPRALLLFRPRLTYTFAPLAVKIRASNDVDDDDDDDEDYFENSVPDDDDEGDFETDDDDDDPGSTVDNSYSNKPGLDSAASFSSDKPDLDSSVDASFSDKPNSDSEYDFDPTIPPEVEDYEDFPTESDEEIAAAYEEMYGPAFSGISVLGNDIYVEDSRRKKGADLGVVTTADGKASDGFEENLVQVRRVTKVVKGGRQLQFRAIVIIGDKQGHVGVGVAKGREVSTAVEKSARDARRNIVTVPMTKYLTFPHRLEFTPKICFLDSQLSMFCD